MARATTSSATEPEMVPPEGGWGYAVMLSVSVVFVSKIYEFINVA